MLRSKSLESENRREILKQFRKKRLSGCFDELEAKIIRKSCFNESQ